MAQRPRELGVDVQVEHAALRGIFADDFPDLEPVEPQQPVGLVEAMLALQGRRPQRQLRGGIRDGTEGGVVHATHAELSVQRVAADQDVAIVRRVGTDDHLRALPGRCELRRTLAPRLRLLLRRLRRLDARMQLAHRSADAVRLFLRRQLLQTGFRRQFHVDAEAVGIPAGGGEQLRRGLGNGLQVDIAREPMILAQATGDLHELLHRVIAVADDAAGEEQAFDVIALVELQRQPYDFGRGEACARHVAGHPVDAVGAVVDAEVGQQDLQQRHAAAVRRVGVADPHPFRASHAALAQRMALAGATGRAGGIVLGRVGQDRQLVLQMHAPILSAGISKRETETELPRS